MKVRLAAIDAPEKKQPFGTRSRQSLGELCHEKRAEVRVTDVDRYKRIVGRVSCAGVDANAAQVRRGMAWVYDRYAKDKTLYRLQDEARSRTSPTHCSCLSRPKLHTSAARAASQQAQTTPILTFSCRDWLP